MFRDVPLARRLGHQGCGRAAPARQSRARSGASEQVPARSWHAAQASFGRTCRITLKLAGTYSRTSATSSPIFFIVAPQSGQVQAGACSTVSRGRRSGSGRRAGRSFCSGLAAVRVHPQSRLVCQGRRAELRVRPRGVPRAERARAALPVDHRGERLRMGGHAAAISYYRTLEHRRLRAALIRRWRPWERSTGPRTPEGKARASRNAYKGGARGMLRELRRILRHQDELRQDLARPTNENPTTRAWSCCAPC